MSRYGTGLNAGALKLRVYNNFRGVDFTGGDVDYSRSPDALNMWKNYKHLGKLIETRPGISQEVELDGDVFGLFFYEVNNVKHIIIHAGVKLYDYNMNTETSTLIKSSGMKPARSVGFVFNNILFIKDGLNYYEYNGTTLKVVEGYVPNIAIHKLIDGQTEMVQEANLLTDYVREQFIPDGEKTLYKLSQTQIQDVSVWDISGVTPVEITTGFTTDLVNGEIEFNTAPTESYMATIEIKYKKDSDGRETADKCKLACVFDNRVFMSGNENHPNLLVWSGLNNPRYIANTSYTTLGNDAANVKALVPGNNALWSFKEPSHSNTTIFYSTPYEVYDGKLDQTIKTYSTAHSSITTGCKNTGINFNDDIVFISDYGLEGISSDITTEQVIAHRSSLVDAKMLNCSGEPVLVEWKGYLLIIYGNEVFLADSRQKVGNGDHMEYEWFYWDLLHNIKSAIVIDNKLYLGTTAVNGVSKVYVMDDTEYALIDSYWTTKQDDFDYPQMLKTTNKKGFKVNVANLFTSYNTDLKIETKLDNNDFEELATLTNTKGFVVTKIKKKKWTTIQLKFSSTIPFGIYEATLESYIGSYVKRS